MFAYTVISLVQLRAKKKFFTIENYLLVRIFLKIVGLHSPVISGKNFVFAIKSYLLVRFFVLGRVSLVVLPSPSTLRSILGEKV